MKEVFRFINGGEEPREQRGPHLVDWPMDFPRIIAPVNRVLGYEARAVDYDIETNTAGYTGGLFSLLIQRLETVYSHRSSESATRRPRESR